ncbi:MAG: hypothetical protein QNJ31_03930 [Candidatus Caenarcaniphilales bacterium]|nr:hypothetical protein [Candidatus Caenarcaniphilales bacterium]
MAGKINIFANSSFDDQPEEENSAFFNENVIDESKQKDDLNKVISIDIFNQKQIKQEKTQLSSNFSDSPEEIISNTSNDSLDGKQLNLFEELEKLRINHKDQKSKLQDIEFQLKDQISKIDTVSDLLNLTKQKIKKVHLEQKKANLDFHNNNHKHTASIERTFKSIDILKKQFEQSSTAQKEYLEKIEKRIQEQSNKFTNTIEFHALLEEKINNYFSSNKRFKEKSSYQKDLTVPSDDRLKDMEELRNQILILNLRIEQIFETSNVLQSQINKTLSNSNFIEELNSKVEELSQKALNNHQSESSPSDEEISNLLNSYLNGIRDELDKKLEIKMNLLEDRINEQNQDLLSYKNINSNNDSPEILDFVSDLDLLNTRINESDSNVSKLNNEVSSLKKQFLQEKEKYQSSIEDFAKNVNQTNQRISQELKSQATKIKRVLQILKLTKSKFVGLINKQSSESSIKEVTKDEYGKLIRGSYRREIVQILLLVIFIGLVLFDSLKGFQNQESIKTIQRSVDAKSIEINKVENRLQTSINSLRSIFEKNKKKTSEKFSNIERQLSKKTSSHKLRRKIQAKKKIKASYKNKSSVNRALPTKKNNIQEPSFQSVDFSNIKPYVYNKHTDSEKSSKEISSIIKSAISNKENTSNALFSQLVNQGKALYKNRID